MARYDQRQLYIKRVLREIRRHSDDKYIDIEIEEDIRKKFGDKPDSLAVAEMPDWRLASVNYRLKYFESAEAVDRFTPHSVERFLKNFTAPALQLLAAFVVFRLFPTTEYAAYAVCALAAVAAAIQQHICFCKLKYMLIAMILPQFLLIWYPAKAAAASATGFGSFWNLLISEGNRYILVLILASAIFFVLTTAILHAYNYADNPKRKAVIFSSIILILATLAGFTSATAARNRKFDVMAAQVLADLRPAYEEYLETGNSEEFFAAAEKADDVVRKNFHSRSKMDETYNNSFLKTVTVFDLCRRAKESGNCQELMDYYFTDYDENDPGKTLNSDAIFDTYDQLAARFEYRLTNTDGSKYADIHELASGAGGIYAELYAVIDDCHTAWIFSGGKD